MEIYLSEQLQAIVRALLLGVAFGISYDVLRISRIFIGIRYFGSASVCAIWRTPPSSFAIPSRMCGFLSACGMTLKWRKKRIKKTAVSRWRLRDTIQNIAVFFGDLIYFTLAGAAFCIYIHFSGGEFRMFMLISLLIGFAGYYFTVGRAVIFASGYIVRSLRMCASYAAYFVIRPIYLSLLTVIGIFFFVFDKILLISQNIYDIIYVRKFSSRKKRLAEAWLLADMP